MRLAGFRGIGLHHHTQSEHPLYSMDGHVDLGWDITDAAFITATPAAKRYMVEQGEKSQNGGYSIY